MNLEEKHIYFIPGMAANSRIFEYLKLPEHWKLHYLEWLVPDSPQESLEDYVRRMSGSITAENPIIIGVSFGGVVAQEMIPLVRPEKTILISSIKTRYEMPTRMRFARHTHAHKILPTSLITHIEKYEKFAFGNVLKKRIKLYKKYLSMRDELYIPWAIHRIVTWNREKPYDNLIHIHGTQDMIFPIKNIRNFIPVEGGTHIMVLDKAREISRLLIEIIE
jgi:pimeloyl-ACP methyl ester carboxylesterase